MTDKDVILDLEKLVESPNNRCFGCGPANPIGLHLKLRRDGGVIRGEFIPNEWHAGWEGIIHGGVLASVLDETMAYVLYYAGVKGLTARMELRYRGAVQGGDELTIEARVSKETARMTDVEAALSRGGKVVVESWARFMKVGSLTVESFTEP